MLHIDLFSGIGGFALAAREVWGTEHKVVTFCEINKYCQQVLKKHWPDAPICEDIKKLKWIVDENDGKIYNQLCDQSNNKPQVYETLNLPILQQKKITSIDSVRIVSINSGSDHQRQKELEDFVPKNADTSSCVEGMGQMLAEADGCEENRTRTIKMDRDMKEQGDIERQKLVSGGVEYLREINIPAKSVESYQERGENLTLITSKNGQNIQSLDSQSKTGEHCAKNVMQTFTGRGAVDLLTGGVPCQPASSAGKRRGKEDDRWLWGETYRIIKEAKPRWVVLENVRGLITLEQGMVFKELITELESIGYEVEPIIIPACAVNAPHRRDRVWIIANSKSQSKRRLPIGEIKKHSRFIITNSHASNTSNARLQRDEQPGSSGQSAGASRSITECDWDENWSKVAQRLCKFYDGISDGLAGYLTTVESRSIMGFIQTIRRIHYATNNEDREKALSVLRQGVSEESVSKFIGRFQEVYVEEVLRCYVHGKSYDEREKDACRISDGSEKTKEGILRKLRNERKFTYSSQGFGLEQQCSCKFDDIVRELSSEIALAEWEKHSKEACNILYNMWKNKCREGVLPEALSSIHVIWRSIFKENTKVGFFRAHYYKRDSSIELDGFKLTKAQHRVERLKALGNAIVSQIAIEIFKAIKECEKQCLN